ncbi:MAG: hypothetical protein HOB82_06430 [Alphaproteobacteria bacterium]|jgi:uncharacterized membrane protein|nr:hypothetical protein [Alphaproteobacteria bacterium]MBT4711146.1 hypothetical protein [Alphaproteobacteria bacterium]MBT5860341.1 hypothetical protein [Alphaproteobacteria bacterium]
MHTTLLTIHFVSIAAGIGISFFMAVLGIVVEKQGPQDAPIVMKYAGVASTRLGMGALTLLWASGLWMTFAYDMASVGGVWFQIKIGFVVLLTIGVSLQMVNLRKMREGGEQAAKAAANSKKLGMGLLASGIIVITTAVLAFG